MSLTPQEIEQFNDEGYVIKEGVFSQADLQPLKDALTEVIDRAAREQPAAGILDDLYADEPFERRLGRIFEASVEAGQAVSAAIMGGGGGGFSGPAMLETLRHPPLLSCVESLIGPDIIGSSVYRIRPKVPHYVRGEVPWHQDSGYFMPHCDRHLIVTCWLPLVDATVENGCLHVLPRAHKEGRVFRHYTGGHGGFLEVPRDEMPAATEPVPIEIAAGDVLFLTNLTPHASFHNTSDQVRWSIDLRYQGTDAPNNVDQEPTVVTAEREPTTMACYPPEADFVIRDTEHPEREIRSGDAFHKLREKYELNRPAMPGRGWIPLQDRATRG